MIRIVLAFDLAQTILDTLITLISYFSGMAFYQSACGFWNNALRLAYNLLGSNVEDFAGGNALSIIENVKPYFNALGTSLMIIFFFYGLFQQSYEDTNMDVYTVVRCLIPLCIGEFLMANFNVILSTITAIASGMVNAITSTDLDYIYLDEPEHLSDIVNGISGDENTIMLLILTFLVLSVCSLVMVVCGGVIIYIVYFRYLKILLCMPFCPLAIASMSGSHEVKRMGFQYFKYFTILALEAVVILIAILLCNAVLSAGSGEIIRYLVGSADAASSTGYFTNLFAYAFVDVFTCCLTVASAKGAETLLQKMFG